MSTYEARTANATRIEADCFRLVREPLDPAVVAAAMQRGRVERSLALWAVLHAVFGRRAAGDRMAA